MSFLPAHPTRPLTAVFARRLGRTALFFTVATVAAFGFISQRVYRDETRRYLIELGEVFAAALQVGPNGDISGSAAALQDRYPRVLAVATLDAFGNIDAVYPERTAHRHAIHAVLERRGEAINMPSPESGEPLALAGVVVPLSDSSSPAARRVCVLLTYGAYQPRWIATVGRFALILAGLSLAWVVVMRRWFNSRVARPLRRVAAVARGPFLGDYQLSAFGRCDLREITEITDLLDHLTRQMSETEAHARRVERESKHQLKTRERGFDRALRRAQDLATIDTLTRVRNRAFLETKLEPLFDEQRKGSADLSAVMIDVDNFKRYNDTEGHLAGDVLLQFVGALVQGAIRSADHAIRYGGDEFLLLFPDVDASMARAIAERLVKLFGQYVSRLGLSHALSLSAGVASLKVDSPSSGHDLLARADLALYAAKRRGKNGVATCSAA